MKNSMLTMAHQVEKGLNWMDKKIEAGTNGIIRAGKFLREVADGIIKCRSDYTIIAIPSIMAGVFYKGVGYAIQGMGWMAQKSYKAGLKACELTGRGFRKVATAIGRISAGGPKSKSTGGFKDKLAEKSEKLDRASERERAKRERLVQRALKANNPLSASEVMALRRREEEKRRDVCKEILRKRYRDY